VTCTLGAARWGQGILVGAGARGPAHAPPMDPLPPPPPPAPATQAGTHTNHQARGASGRKLGPA
jgi:hypothetical protein